MTDRPIKVIIAIPVLFVGGTEVQTLNLVRSLVCSGYSVTVCCYYDYDPWMVSEMESAGADVVLMKLNRDAGNWHLLNKLSRFFAKQRPDFVHVQYIAPGLIPIVAARLARVPTVFATVHQPGGAYGLRAKLLLRTAALLCDAFICNSLAVEKSWFGSGALFDPEKRSSHKHFTIYNAVDVERIARIGKSTDRKSLRESLDVGEGPVVAVVARLRWEKGQKILLEAMAEVIRQIPAAVLLIVGDGPDRNELQQQALRFGIADNVRWLGRRSMEEVFQLYAVMDVVAVPSVFEGFGLVAAEAMASGLPVVASAVEGLAEVLDDNSTGRLVKVGNSREMAAILITLLTDRKLSQGMGERGRLRVEKMFSITRFSESIRSVYCYYGSKRERTVAQY